jgi:hypothetical protein
MYCQKCGLELTSNAKFCNKCGGQTVLISVPPVNDKNLNWFQRHLNLTWIIGIILGEAVLSFLYLIKILVLLDTPSSSALHTFGNILILGIAAVTPFIVSAWVLHRKKRSLLCLMLLFIPFGWLFFLLAENRRQ